MRVRGSCEALRLLVEMEILTQEQAEQVRDQQGNAVVQAMLEQRAIRPRDAALARRFIQDLAATPNRTKFLEAHTNLIALITKNLDHRIASAGERIAKSRDRITQDGYPSVLATHKAAKAES